MDHMCWQTPDTHMYWLSMQSLALVHVTFAHDVASMFVRWFGRSMQPAQLWSDQTCVIAS